MEMRGNLELTAQDPNLQIPKRLRLDARLHRLRIKAATYQGIVQARTRRPQVVISGSYNTGNVGDLALGWTAREILRKLGLSVMLQNSNVVNKYPRPDFLVLGGGGVLPKQASLSLKFYSESYPDLAANTALVGLGGWLDSEDCTPDVHRFLNRVPYFSVRSDRDRLSMTGVVPADQIRVHPDLGFGLPSAFNLDFSDDGDRESRVLGISIWPYFLAQQGNRFVPVREPGLWKLQKRDPQLAQVGMAMGAKFTELIRETVAAYLSRGWKVRAIPFTIEDDTYARVALDGLSVEHAAYTPDPLSVIGQVAKCERFIATRFHSHIFSLLTRTPLLSIGYDTKCVSLWQELQLPEESQVARLDIVQRPAAALDILTNAEPQVIANGTISALSEGAIQGCLDAADAIGAVEQLKGRS